MNTENTEAADFTPMSPTAMLAASDTISIAPAFEIARSLAPMKTAADSLLEQAKRAEVHDQESADKASLFLSVVKNKADRLESYRRSVKKPVDDYAAFIQSLFRPISDCLSDAKKLVSSKASDYLVEQERKLREEREAERRRQEEAALKIAAEAEAAGDAAGAEMILDASLKQKPEPKSATPPQVTNSLGGKLGLRRTWKGTVASPETVLRAILDGRLPWSLISWNQAALNEVARGIGQEGVFVGVRCDHVASASVR